MRECCFCHKRKPFDCFSFRDDRIEQRYAFCNECMTEQVRDSSWPKMEERGGGMLDSWIWKGTYIL